MKIKILLIVMISIILVSSTDICARIMDDTFPVTYYTADTDHISGVSLYDIANWNDTGTATNAKYGHTGKLGQAIYFDGSGDYVTLPGNVDLNLNDTFSLVIWLKHYPHNQGFIWSKNIDAGGVYMTINRIPGPERLQTVVNVGGGLVAAYPTATGLSDSTWHMLTVVVEDATVYTYIDDGGAASAALSAPMDSKTTETTLMGYRKNTGYLLGFMDEIQVYQYGIKSTEKSRIFLENNNGVHARQILNAVKLTNPETGAMSINGETYELTFSCTDIMPGDSIIIMKDRVEQDTNIFTSYGSVDTGYTITGIDETVTVVIRLLNAYGRVVEDTVVIGRTNTSPSWAIQPSPPNPLIQEGESMTFTMRPYDPDDTALLYVLATQSEPNYLTITVTDTTLFYAWNYYATNINLSGTIAFTVSDTQDTVSSNTVNYEIDADSFILWLYMRELTTDSSIYRVWVSADFIDSGSDYYGDGDSIIFTDSFTEDNIAMYPGEGKETRENLTITVSTDSQSTVTTFFSWAEYLRDILFVQESQGDTIEILNVLIQDLEDSIYLLMENDTIIRQYHVDMNDSFSDVTGVNASIYDSVTILINNDTEFKANWANAWDSFGNISTASISSSIYDTLTLIYNQDTMILVQVQSNADTIILSYNQDTDIYNLALFDYALDSIIKVVADNIYDSMGDLTGGTITVTLADTSVFVDSGSASYITMIAYKCWSDSNYRYLTYYELIEIPNPLFTKGDPNDTRIGVWAAAARPDTLTYYYDGTKADSPGVPYILVYPELFDGVDTYARVTYEGKTIRGVTDIYGLWDCYIPQNGTYRLVYQDYYNNFDEVIEIITIPEP